MPLKMHKIISAKVLPEQAGGGFGVSFEFDDGWLEARFHLTKEEAERQAARVGESEPVPDQKSMGAASDVVGIWRGAISGHLKVSFQAARSIG
jgi:hypothetical protein